MGQGGLEPPTPRLSSVCSNQLSYWPPSHPSPSPPTEGPSTQDTPQGAPPGPTGQEPPSQPYAISKASRSSRHGRDTRSAPGPALANPRHHPPIPARIEVHLNHLVLAVVCGRPGPSDQPTRPHPIRDKTRPAKVGHEQASYSDMPANGPSTWPPHQPSLKGGDPAAGSPTATLLRLHPSR